MADLKGVCENMKGYAIELKSIISYLKVEERTFKVINDEFGANVATLNTTLKTTQAEAS